MEDVGHVNQVYLLHRGALADKILKHYKPCRMCCRTHCAWCDYHRSTRLFKEMKKSEEGLPWIGDGESAWPGETILQYMAENCLARPGDVYGWSMGPYHENARAQEHTWPEDFEYSAIGTLVVNMKTNEPAEVLYYLERLMFHKNGTIPTYRESLPGHLFRPPTFRNVEVDTASELVPLGRHLMKLLEQMELARCHLQYNSKCVKPNGHTLEEAMYEIYGDGRPPRRRRRR